MTSEQVKEHIAALIAEREHYTRYGRADRVAAVDEQLRFYERLAAPPVKRAAKITAPKRTEL